MTLGDGSETLFDLYSVTILWDGQFREIDVAESETDFLQFCPKSNDYVAIIIYN